MGTGTAKSSVRERIMATAFDLFYRQGYRGTGINQVIAESGVAKASFYDHFPSKGDLLYAYAKELARYEMADIREQVGELKTARARFFGPLRILEPWFEESGYRGCPFQNIAVELPAEEERVREVVREHRENVLEFLRELTEAVVEAEGLEGVDVEEVAERYLVVFEGAIAVAVAYREAWPVERAVGVMEECLVG